jgi:hypothetical protein
MLESMKPVVDPDHIAFFQSAEHATSHQLNILQIPKVILWVRGLIMAVSLSIIPVKCDRGFHLWPSLSENASTYARHFCPLQTEDCGCRCGTKS